MDEYRRRVRFPINGTPARLDLTLTRVVPKVNPPPPKDLALDFAFAVGGVLELKKREWRALKLPMSRSVPRYIVQQLYDPALFYGAWKTGLLPPGFGAYAAERMALRLWAGIPEILVKYRFYLGFADENGEIDLVSGDGKEIKPTISDPYQRLFCLQDSDVMRQVRAKFGPRVVLRRDGEVHPVADTGLSVGQTLGFGPCLRRIFDGKQHDVQRFLLKIYKDVRIQEMHTGRLADNAVFEVSDLVTGLVRVANFLYTNDLGLPFRRSERGPFAIPFLRTAGSRPITKEKSLSHAELTSFMVKHADRWYAKSVRGW